MINHKIIIGVWAILITTLIIASVIDIIKVATHGGEYRWYTTLFIMLGIMLFLIESFKALLPYL